MSEVKWRGKVLAVGQYRAYRTLTYTSPTWLFSLKVEMFSVILRFLLKISAVSMLKLEYHFIGSDNWKYFKNLFLAAWTKQ